MKEIKKLILNFNYTELILKISGLFLLIVMSFLTISFNEGTLTLPFIDMNNSYADESEDENSLVFPKEEAESATKIEESTEPVNLSHITNPDVLTTIIPVDAKNDTNGVFPLFSQEMKSQGYVLSHRNYEKGKIEFYQIDLNDNQYIPETLHSFKDGEQQLSLKVDMGCIFVLHNDGNGEILNNAGEKMIGNLKYRSIQLIFQRDKRGLPVFWNGNDYRVYDEEQKLFVESDYDTVLNNRGLAFSYSKYFGYPVNSTLTRFYNPTNKKWGYKNSKTDETVINAVYDEAYNFNNGYAVAIKYEYKNKKRLYFINESGEVLNSDYFAPDSLQKSNLGFLYFENGLTRALSRKYTWYSLIVDEIPIICYPDGTQYKLPPDYTLKAYSDGVMLLEKAGKYGFMDSKGNWIAQPIYSYASPFNEGVAVIGLSDTQKALIDTQGNLLTNFDFAHITDCSGGVIALFKNDQGWTIVNKAEQKK